MIYMKKILFFLLIVQIGFGQSVEEQTAILTRETAEPVVMLTSIDIFQKLQKDNRIDYVMVTNEDNVNVFYYENGELKVLRPQTTDVFLATRDGYGRVLSYPFLFFDKSSLGRKVHFRVGVCKACRSSPIGVQYGYVPLKR